jgi:hypothetical protein
MLKRYGLILIGLLLLIYGLVVVIYSNQTKEIGILCAFDRKIQAVFPNLDGLMPQGKPAKDDQLISIAGQEINNWSDYLRTLACEVQIP